MATPALDHQLQQWERSGLITAEQRAGIRDFEARAGRDAAGQLATSRQGWIEVLAYLGAIVTVAGVLTLVYSSRASLEWIAALTLALGVAALVAALSFVRRATPSSLRAAGACVAVAAIAVGVAAGELATAASLFTRTTQVTYSCGYGACVPLTVTTMNQAGNVLAGACAALVVVVALIRFVPGQLAAAVAIAAAYVVAGATINVTGLDTTRSAATIALVIVATSAALAAFGEVLRHRQPAVHAVFGFAGVVGATVPLFVLGGGSNVDLDVAGAVIAAASLVVGVATKRFGIAYGAVIGVAGLVVDVGVRTFPTATARGLFFVASGAGCVAALLALNRLQRRPRAALPRPPG